MGVQTSDIGFATPKEHFLARIPRRTASFDVFWVKIGARVLAVAFLKNPLPKNSRVTLCRGARNHVCAKSKPPKSVWIKFCLVVDITDVVTYTNLVSIGWGVFGWRGGSNFPISHRLWSSPLQHSRTTVRVCDRFILHFVHRFITCIGLHMSQIRTNIIILSSYFISILCIVHVSFTLSAAFTDFALSATSWLLGGSVCTAITREHISGTPICYVTWEKKHRPIHRVTVT